MVNQSVHGYKSGLRQLETQIFLSFDCPETVDFTAVDKVIQKIYGLQIDEWSTETSRPHSTAETFSERAMIIARSILQDARLPIFDLGVILNTDRSEENTQKWHVQIAIPAIDHISLKLLIKAYRSALRVLRQCIYMPQESLNLSAIQSAISEKTVQPIRARVVAGISTTHILKAAYDLDIPFRHLGSGLYQLGWGSRARLIDRSSVESDSAFGSKMSQNKLWTSTLTRSAGLPSPTHILTYSFKQAQQAAQKLGWPLVVKPADLDRGEGVTVGIHNLKQLAGAFNTASKHSKKTLIEKEVPGVCYRIFIANNEMLYALRRGPRAVIGDGEHTVSELIELANKKLLATPPWKHSKAIPLDELALDSITENGFSPETTPESGTTVPIRKIESSEWSGDITDASDQVHPDNRAIALRAAELFQLSNAGIDIISSDISIPWHQNGAIINEVNFAPYFGGHPTARARLPHYFENFIEGDGRIPVEVVIGGSDAEKTARKIQQLQIDSGTACYLTSHYLTITPSLQEMPFPSISLFTRTIALLMNRKVESVVLLIQTDELIQTGLPVDRIRHITQTGGVISEWQSNNSPIDNERRKMLDTLLSSYLIATTPL